MNVRTSVLSVLLCLVLAGLVGTVAVGADDDAPATKPRWEHIAMTHDGAQVNNSPDLSKQIIRLGNEGWELVTVTTIVKEGTTEKTVFYFKRPK